MLLKTNVVSFEQDIPPAVKCLQYSSSTGKMYSIHADSSIVKWDAKFALTQQVFIPPADEELQCAVLFGDNELPQEHVDDRVLGDFEDVLIIGGTSGQIYCCNFEERKLSALEQTFGGAVMAMKQCNKEVLALISQDKLLRFYSAVLSDVHKSAASSELLSQRSVSLTLLSTVKGSKQSPEALMCLDSVGGNTVVLGSVGVLAMVTWKKTKHLVDQKTSIEFFPVPKDMKAGKTSKHNRQNSVFDKGGHAEVSIRAVLLLDPTTCVTGDNFGRCMWWDLNTGTVMQSVRSHSAAITTLVADSHKRVTASGVDPYLVSFQQSNDGTWSQSAVLKGVQSEVTAMVVVPANSHKTKSSRSLYIGSKAPFICYWDFNPDRYENLVPFNPNFNGKVVPETRQVMLSKSTEISLHKLGNVSDDTVNENCLKFKIPVELTEGCKKQVSLQLPKAHYLIDSEISIDGKWLCYASYNSGVYFLKLFQVINSEVLSNVPLKTRFRKAIANVSFISNDSILICVFIDGSLLKYNLIAGGHPETIQLECQHVYRCFYSNFHSLLAVICEHICLRLFDMSENFDHICDLPTRESYPTGVSFSDSNDKASVFVQYSDFTLVQFYVQKKRYSKWCETFLESDLQSKMFKRSIGTSIVTFGEKCEKIVNYSQRFLNVVWVEDLKNSRKRSHEETESDSEPKSIGKPLQVLREFKILRNICKIDNDEVVLFMLSPNDVNGSLPEGFSRKAFGT